MAKIAADLQSAYTVPAAWSQICLEHIAPVIGILPDGQQDHSAARALRHARRYAASPSGWIVFQGPPGNGKTMLLAGIRNAFIARGKTTVFLPARSIADMIYRAIQPDATFSLYQIEQDLRLPALVCIDELDKVDWSKPFIHDTFFNIFNWRHEQDACTAIAFNDPGRIPDAMYSRLRTGTYGDNSDDGIFRITVEDQRPYLPGRWEPTI